MLPEKMCGTCVFSMRLPFVSKAGTYKNRIYHRNCQQLRCSYLCSNNNSGSIRLKACEDVDMSLFSGVCGLWGNISDSASVKVNGMMGIVAPCIVGFSMRLGDSMKVGLGLPWYIRMIPYDRTCVRQTVDTIYKHGKKLKDSGFSLVKLLFCWTICEQYHQVSSTSRTPKKLRFSTYALLGGEMTVEIVFPSLIASCPFILYCWFALPTRSTRMNLLK